MGTNLSQVFIQNGPTFENNESTPAFTDVSSSQIGIWNAVSGGWIATKLFEKTFVPTDTNASDPAEANFANPNWLYKGIQITQGSTTGNRQISSNLIDTRNIKSLSFDHYAATAGHTILLTPSASTFAPGTIGDVTVRFVIRTLPRDIMSYYDADNTGYTILSGNDPLPLGIYNTTNHKVIPVTIAEEDYTNVETFIDALDTAIAAHGLLSKVIEVTNADDDITLESKHVGVIFDVAISNEDGDSMIAASAAINKIVPTVTGENIGVGNPWQVLGEEIRTRGRYGNYNRTWLPTQMPTYTNGNNKYHKITLEYATNWPSSTGIAPAGELNQIVMYVGGSTAIADNTASENLGAIFGLTSTTGEVFDNVKYVW
jgi:hypothetical protein